MAGCDIGRVAMLVIYNLTSCTVMSLRDEMLRDAEDKAFHGVADQD